MGAGIRFSTCTVCGSDKGYFLKKKCAACTNAENNTRYRFTDAQNERLRELFAPAQKPTARSAALNIAEEETAFPRYILIRQLGRLGLGERRRRWSATETAYLHQKAGVMPVAAIARHLNRSQATIMEKAQSERLSMRVTAGFSLKAVMDLFGVGAITVQAWITAGWLQKSSNRFSQRDLSRLLRDHLHDIDIRRINQTWLKVTLEELIAPERRMAA
jgi:hypothetical protein